MDGFRLGQRGKDGDRCWRLSEVGSTLPMFEPELVVGSGLLVMVATRMMLGSAPVLLSAAAAMVVFGGVMGGDGGVGVLLPELYAVMVAPVSASSKLMVLRKTTRMM